MALLSIYNHDRVAKTTFKTGSWPHTHRKHLCGRETECKQGKEWAEAAGLWARLASCREPRGRLRSPFNKKRLKIHSCCDHRLGPQPPDKRSRCVQIHPLSQNPAETSHMLPDVTGSKSPHSAPGTGISHSWHKTQTQSPLEANTTNLEKWKDVRTKQNSL